MGSRLTKEFVTANGPMDFGGNVISMSTCKKTKQLMYRVRYEDGDQEDLYEKELRPLLVESRTFYPCCKLVNHHLSHIHTYVEECMARRYVAAREKAIALFTHYPVLSIKVHHGRGKCISTQTHTHIRTLSHTHTLSHEYSHTLTCSHTTRY